MSYAHTHMNVHLRMHSSTWRPQLGEAIIVLRIALYNDLRGMFPLGDLEEPVSTGLRTVMSVISRTNVMLQILSEPMAPERLRPSSH